MGRWISNHHRSKTGTVLLALGFHVSHIDVAILIALGDYYCEANHLRAGGVRAMGTCRNQADIAMTLAARMLPSVDHQEACVFALAARIGLQADAAVAGGLAEPFAQLFVKQLIALALIGGAERMDIGKLRPSDRNHLACGIELHGA